MLLLFLLIVCLRIFFFNDTATTEIYTYWHTLSHHDALPISDVGGLALDVRHFSDNGLLVLGENFRQRREALLQEFVFSLFGEFLCPVHRQIELAAAVVELPGFR